MKQLFRNFLGKVKKLFTFWEDKQDARFGEVFEIDIDSASKRLAKHIRHHVAFQQRLKDLDYRKSRSQSKNWQKWR